MKNYLRKTSIFVVAFSIPLIVLDFYMRKPGNDEFSAKIAFLENNLDSCEALLMGSSHTHTGLNPEWIEMNSVNVANFAQPFYYDYKILETYADKMPRLKAVVLPLSYSTFYTVPSRRQEKLYSIHWGLPPYSGKINMENYSVVLAEGLGNCLDRLIKGENHFQHKGWHASDDVYAGGMEVAEKKLISWHELMEGVEMEECTKWLEKTIAFCKQKELCVVLYIPPYTTFVNELLADDTYRQSILDYVNELKKDNQVRIIDANDNEVFSTNMFKDPDHVNRQGAKLLTQIINTALKNCELNTST